MNVEEESYQLFKTDLCGFCYRVRDFADQNCITLVLRDTISEQGASEELLQGGGNSMVPCLRIQRSEEVVWMYESMDIINYLNGQVGAGNSGSSQ